MLVNNIYINICICIFVYIKKKNEKFTGKLRVIKKRTNYSGKTLMTNFNRQCTTNNYSCNLLLFFFVICDYGCSRIEKVM